MIETIRKKLTEVKGKRINFRYNGSRNQIEEFTGIITEMYDYVFTIKIINSNNKLKSFSYSDVLTNTLEIFKK